jgi:hypothetical protein
VVRFPAIFAFFTCLIFISCSRQVTDLGQVSRMQASNSFKAPGKLEMNTISVPNVSINQQTGLNLGSLSKGITSFKQTFNKQAATVKEKIASRTSKIVAGETSFTYPRVADGVSQTSELRINKAGFILIGAAILGYFLHILLAACIVILVLGLIILLAPLFGKRRY